MFKMLHFSLECYIISGGIDESRKAFERLWRIPDTSRVQCPAGPPDPGHIAWHTVVLLHFDRHSDNLDWFFRLLPWPDTFQRFPHLL